MKKILLLSFVFIAFAAAGQSSLSIPLIMRGEKFTGYSPEDIRWSPDSKKIFFSWNREMEPVRSLYFYDPAIGSIEKATIDDKKNQLPPVLAYNRERTRAVYEKEGDIFLLDVRPGNIRTVISSVSGESSPAFSLNGDKIFFTANNNLWSWDIDQGTLSQLTDFRQGKEKPDEASERKEKDTWLYYNQLMLFSTLEQRKKLREEAEMEADEIKSIRPKVIFTGNAIVSSMRMSPDGNFVTYISSLPMQEKTTVIPNFVTETGYTEDRRSRSKVGMSSASSGKFNIYDIKNDTVYSLETDSIPGIADKPEYRKDYAGKESKEKNRGVFITGPVWSDDGKNAVIDIYSDDHKDRWIMLLDIRSGRMKLLDRQHDEAWIGGPGVSRFTGWIPGGNTIYFQSEESGYSHLYTLDVQSGKKQALTSGMFEVYDPLLSKDGKTWYFISNEGDPGIRELYEMPVNGGTRTRLTNFGGGVEYELSPDEKWFALRVSFSNRPWELYILGNSEKAKPRKVTESTTPEFRAYNWRIPEFVSIKASDGVAVPARLYKPATPVNNGPAVIFVHGAGYLQNVHKWWSSYSREYMFHNFLVDNGYTVLDIDYRGSSGYGRDWRTSIYRHMGGRDLQDHIDGARYLAELHGVDPLKIGIYGGSYGGFITLMALFTSPGTFAAGAALRPVTDWAHYNHGYTSNILNTPVADSLSYMKSSPIYYADGLKDRLLICHGMVDDNVHFQDVVRLVQRLIELGKDNWELAVYPLESHGFVEETSWTDEYRRIFKLFEETLK